MSAELLALAERQVAELSRPLSDRKAETVTDRLPQLPNAMLRPPSAFAPPADAARL